MKTVLALAIMSLLSLANLAEARDTENQREIIGLKCLYVLNETEPTDFRIDIDQKKVVVKKDGTFTSPEQVRMLKNLNRDKNTLDRLKEFLETGDLNKLKDMTLKTEHKSWNGEIIKSEIKFAKTLVRNLGMDNIKFTAHKLDPDEEVEFRGCTPLEKLRSGPN
jgi:hypothetical protein